MLEQLLPMVGWVLAAMAAIVVFAHGLAWWRRRRGVPLAHTFRYAQVRFNLTHEVRLGESSLRASGERMPLLMGGGLKTHTLADPARGVLAMGIAETAPYELVVAPDGIELRSEEGRVRAARESLSHVFGCSPRYTRGAFGRSAHLIYVCLQCEDERIGRVAVGLFAYTMGLGRTDHPYDKAFREAEDFAHRLCEVLDVPYRPGYYKGIFAPLIELVR